MEMFVNTNSDISHACSLCTACLVISSCLQLLFVKICHCLNLTSLQFWVLGEMALHLSKHISILGSLFLYLKTCIICINRDTWPSLFTNYSHFSQTCTSSTIFFQLNYQPVISVYQSVFIIPYIYLISRHLSVMLIGQKNTSSHVSFLTYPPPKYQKYLFWSIGQLGQKYLLVCSKTNC